jgi:methylase of polypeptide subunit release factors
VTAVTRARTCRFGPLDIEFDARVLEPRPWTLMQSEWAAELAAALPTGPILELCAGAGHIGLAAAVLADRDLVQVEADPVPGGYAAVNAAAAQWASRTDLRVARLQEALHADERFPLIVADPPYLPTDEIERWPDDPVTAIDGGPDGMELIDACLAVASAHLSPGGVLLLQVAGAAQGERLRPAGLEVFETRSHDPERAVVALHHRGPRA